MTDKERLAQEAEQRRKLRENPPPMTRATVIAAAAYAILQDGQVAAAIVLDGPGPFVQNTRKTWAANGYPFTDGDLREIWETVRRLVEDGASQKATDALETMQ